MRGAVKGSAGFESARTAFFAAVLLVPALCFGGEIAPQPKITIEPRQPGPGDIVTVTVQAASGGAVEGTFDGKPLHFNPSRDSHKAVVGIDLYTQSGAYPLAISVNGAELSRTLKVVKKKYRTQYLTLPKDKVELSPEDEARVEREAALLRTIWPQETPRQWSGAFINPREGEIISTFGLRRVINKIPKSSHTGVDVRSAEGEPVRAPNDGVIALVDDQFYAGNAVIVDHGQGIYTMFFHLSKILVTQGQPVKKGDTVGLVGTTGRSSGPHLHWGVRMQGARVDPLKLLELKLE